MKRIENYTIYCTPEQTKKALKIGVPIAEAMSRYNAKTSIESIKRGNETLEDYANRGIALVDEIYSKKALKIPTAEQLIGWLEEQGIWISILYGYEVIDKWAFDLDGEKYIDYISSEFNSRKEATLAAIDAALDYLEKQKGGD